MSTLDRASHFYRVGYRDAEACRQYRIDLDTGSFAAYDYAEGYHAGFNALYWDAVRENERRDPCK